MRAARKYIELTAGGPLIHRNVTGEISGLAGYLKLERNRVPEMSFARPTDYIAYCSPAMIRTSRVTNRRVYGGGRLPGPEHSIF